MRFRGRSYMAFALTPEAPVAEWLAEIDNWIKSSAGFFVGRPMVLDLAAVSLSGAGVTRAVIGGILISMILSLVVTPAIEFFMA